MPKPLLINKYFKLYRDFFNTDLESSIIEDRSFQTIELFRISLISILHKDIILEDAKELLNELKNVILEEKRYFNQITIFEEKYSALSDVTNKFKKVHDSIIEFFEAYTYISEVLAGNENEYRILQDILVEFNNAMSHFLTAIYTDGKKDGRSKENIKLNISKSNSHLYRGALDAFKEIIKINQMKVRRDKEKKALLNNTTLEDFYIQTRILEANNIGKRESEKKEILNNYKKLAMLVINNYTD
jgi:hypothetical protein